MPKRNICLLLVCSFLLAAFCASPMLHKCCTYAQDEAEDEADESEVKLPYWQEYSAQQARLLEDLKAGNKGLYYSIVALNPPIVNSAVWLVACAIFLFGSSLCWHGFAAKGRVVIALISLYCLASLLSFFWLTYLTKKALGP
ncbi:MAG: hypothetical protein KJ818_02615 [Candidatus Omnitrophica bacterium]|nr:hypothetical protein [Candidatus Omnitrophota bacterium]